MGSTNRERRVGSSSNPRTSAPMAGPRHGLRLGKPRAAACSTPLRPASTVTVFSRRLYHLLGFELVASVVDEHVSHPVGVAGHEIGSPRVEGHKTALGADP